MAETKVGIALSGGGHRAALWGLGGLLYLVDAGVGPSIGCVSSVSGGSLTNGWVGQQVDLHSVAPDDFRKHVRPVARAAATKGTVFAAPLTWAYLVLMVAIAAATVWSAMVISGWLVVVGLVVLGWLAQQRGWVCARSFDRALFKGGPLSGLHTAVDHVVCATELQSAEQLFFSGRFVCSYRHGWGRPGDLPLARAVQSSAALPGAFTPSVLRARRHEFVDGEHAGAKRLLLSDGGVYDNMGTEWLVGVGDRNRQWAAHRPGLHEPSVVVVVNASAGLEWTERRSPRVPLLGEVRSLLAVKDVMYDQTTATRRRLLMRRFWAAERTVTPPMPEPVLSGTLVQIGRSPFELPNRFRHGRDDRAARARAVLDALAAEPESEADWDRVARLNAGVGTTLSAVGAEAGARLLRHAYALTMANAHVLLGYPLRPIPSLAELEAWVR